MSYIVPDSAKESAASLLAYAKEIEAEALDFRFPDIRGHTQHFTVPVATVDEGDFAEGFGFDGSSVRGFQSIEQSDLILIPDATTAYIDPFFERKTLALYVDILDPISREPYGRDPRGVAHRAEAHLLESGIADTSFFGPEAEFFVFSNVQYENNQYTSYYQVDSHEGFWNTASEDPAHTYLNRIKEGYYPLPPMDKTHNMRADMVAVMLECGIPVELHHHEVGGAGQAEIDIRFNTLLAMCDQMQVYKYIVRNVAHQHGLTATFMPKPLFEENGTGMHVHMSLWKDGDTLFYDKSGYANLSQTALHFTGGILKHAPALLAFTNPTTNSYRRLVPGYEAPVNLVYSNRNRSAAVRIPVYSASPKATRIEARFPDPACNPYFALPALLMAGLDGVRNQIDPGEPADYDLYENPGGTPQVPGNLGDVLAALQADKDFLLQGDVFTEDIIDNFVGIKQLEADAVSMRPHPYEFQLYLDT